MMRKKTAKIVFWISILLLVWLFVYFTVKGDLLMALLVTVLLGLVGSFFVFWEDK